MVGNVISAITGVVDGAINTAKSLLGISSPSKVFRKIGVQTMQGMAKGIDAEANHVSKMMDEAVADVCNTQANVDINGNISKNNINSNAKEEREKYNMLVSAIYDAVAPIMKSGFSLNADKREIGRMVRSYV